MIKLSDITNSPLAKPQQRVNSLSEIALIASQEPQAQPAIQISHDIYSDGTTSTVIKAEVHTTEDLRAVLEHIGYYERTGIMQKLREWWKPRKK